MQIASSFAASPRPAGLEQVLQPAEVRMMLIAGGDLQAMEEAALTFYRAGHIPVLCEWFSYPLTSIGHPAASVDVEFQALMHPIAERLLARCDGVLRLDGLAGGADLLVSMARARGLRVYRSVSDALQG